MNFWMSKIVFFGGGLIFEHFRQIDNFETPEKNTWRWFGPHFFFPVSFPYWVTVRIMIWRTKVHIFPTFWPPKNSQIDDAQGKFSKKFQTALATVQNVRLTHGIRQILLETCMFLMVPCWVWYDHYRGRYRHFKIVRIYLPNPVHCAHHNTLTLCTGLNIASVPNFCWRIPEQLSSLALAFL